jgi:histidyl-tRNA synthetase
VVGERDLADSVAQLKNMATGEQVAVPLAELTATIKERLR